MTKQTKIESVIAQIREQNQHDLDFCTRVQISHYPLRYKVEENERIEIWSDNKGSFFLDTKLLVMCTTLKIDIMFATHCFQKPNGDFRDYPAAILYV